MNKKLLTLGVAVLAVAFLVFSSFKKTREQQMAEIDQMVTMKLDELRAQKDAECTERVNAEADRRFQEVLAERAAAKPGQKQPSKPKPGSGGKGPNVDPLPQPTPTDPQKERPGAAGNPTPEQQKERPGAAKPGDVEQQKKRPGAAGGGN